MKINRSPKILFFVPQFHSSYFFRDELEKLGYKSNIFLPWTYPEIQIWSTNRVKRGIRWCEELVYKPNKNILEKLAYPIAILIAGMYFTYLFLSHTHILIYGNMMKCGLLFGRYLPLVRFARIFGTKFFLWPSGCRDEDLRTVWELRTKNTLCGNCGFSDRCNDRENKIHFELARVHCTKIANSGYNRSTQLSYSYYRHMSIDLNLWNPSICPTESDAKRNLVIFHGFLANGRDHDGKNLKGSPYVIQAVKELQEEGVAVELVYATGVKSSEVRFEQAKADIIVDQLLYGWWGSISLEGFALGKPVVCFISEEFESNFLNQYPEYNDKFPIVNANPTNIKEVLRKLLNDKAARDTIGKKSREFAEDFLNPERNTKELLEFFDIAN